MAQVYRKVPGVIRLEGDDAWRSSVKFGAEMGQYRIKPAPVHDVHVFQRDVAEIKIAVSGNDSVALRNAPGTLDLEGPIIDPICLSAPGGEVMEISEMQRQHICRAIDLAQGQTAQRFKGLANDFFHGASSWNARGMNHAGRPMSTSA